MVDCRPNIADPRLSVPERSKAWSGDESTIPDSTLSVYSDGRDTEFDVTSSLPTVRSLSPASNFLEDYVSSPENTLKYENTNGYSFEQGKDTSLDSCFQKQDIWSFSYRFNPEMESCFANSKPTPPIPDASSPDHRTFLPVNPMPGQASVARTASPGMNKMLLSLLDHPVERQCSPVASTLYKNTATHCNPSWLGQYTLDECVVSWHCSPSEKDDEDQTTLFENFAQILHFNSSLCVSSTPPGDWQFLRGEQWMYTGYFNRCLSAFHTNVCIPVHTLKHSSPTCLFLCRTLYTCYLGGS